jgi:predicted kinase
VRPCLILLKGHPATGKSTLARALARRLRWPLIDKDDVKDFIADLPGGNGLAYEVSWRIVRTQLSLGISVIVDTPLSYPISYETGGNLAAQYDAQLLVVETILDEEVWRQRLESRELPTQSQHKIHSWALMQALLAHYDGCWRYPIDPAHHLRVDTTVDIERLVDTVLAGLGIGDQGSGIGTQTPDPQSPVPSHQSPITSHQSQ